MAKDKKEIKIKKEKKVKKEKKEKKNKKDKIKKEKVVVKEESEEEEEMTVDAERELRTFEPQVKSESEEEEQEESEEEKNEESEEEEQKESEDESEEEKKEESEEESEEEERKEESEEEEEMKDNDNDSSDNNEESDEESEEEQPNKKKKIEKETKIITAKLKDKIKFADVSDKRKEAPNPYIINFPNAPPPPSSLKNYFNDNPPSTVLKVAVYHKKDPRKLHQRIITGETDRLEYISDNFLAPHNINKYIIGVYNKKEKTMKLIESPHIFVMQQKIKTLEDESIDSIKDTDVARKLQIEAFGGRKSKQRLSTYVENRVSEDNASANFSSSISHSILAKITSDTDLLGGAGPVREDLPPFDSETSDPKSIYKLQDIITDEIEEVIAPNVMSLSTITLQSVASFIENNKFPATTQSHLSELSSKIGLQKKKFAIHVMFLTYLIRFYKGFRTTAESSLNFVSRKMEIPLTVLHRLLTLFTTKVVGDNPSNTDDTRYILNSSLKNKVVNYIIIVHLILSGYSMNINTLMEDLGFDKRKMGTFVLSVGCKLTSKRIRKANEEGDEMRVTATLTAPIQFPDLERKKMGNRN